MAPTLNLLTTALALAAGADAFPVPNSFKTFWQRYYGDANGLTRPAELMDKRGSIPGGSIPGGWSYAGCRTESMRQRLLQGFEFRSHSNTPAMCTTECAKRGYTIAGTEFGDECYCGNAFTGSGGKVVADSLCVVPCHGDRTEKCGAAWYLSLYTYNATDGPAQTTDAPAKPTPTGSTGWTDLGCTVDGIGGVRVLNGWEYSNDQSTTPDTCQQLCSSKGFSYAGLEHGNECWCGNSLQGTVQWGSSGCNRPCTGNSAITCGGDWALQVYQFGGSGTKPTTTTVQPPSTPTTTTTTTTNTVPTTTPTAIPISNQPHYVWAHHMVGNTYPYGQSDWAHDIQQAQAHGIDGFALNMGSSDWEPARVADAYRAAEASGNFKLFLSLDMTSLGCGSTGDANNLVNLIKSVGSSSAQAKVDGKVLVSTFSGDACTFGTGSNNAWKTMFKDVLAGAGLPVYFVPAFFGNQLSYDWLDGELSWNGAWPMGNQKIDTNLRTDATFFSKLETGSPKAYMTSVSPFFFTHFGPATWNKNWIYRSDDWLYCARWEQIIAQRDRSAMTQILTWNDYGESTYIGPIKGALPPTSDRWVDGIDHTGLAPLTSYYATAFKTGSYPAITKDTIILWSRPHPAKANAAVDNVGRPTNWQWTDDNLYAVVLATAPATVTLTAGSNSQTFSVGAGLSKLKMPSAPGGMGGTVTRDGATVASYASGPQFSYTLNPQSYNFNYFVGSSA